MSQKLHCDFCDSTNGVRSSGTEPITTDVNGIRRTIKLKLDFRSEYKHDDENDSKDLCHDCQLKVFRRLFEKFGGRAASEEAIVIEVDR